jgi:phenylacetate-coenzyme A ligase PaaK-like adenylate-forming protein
MSKTGIKNFLSIARIAFHILQLKRNQWKSPEQLQKIQLKRLKAIVHYAYYHVPYYTKLFKSVEFLPGDLKSLSDIHKIPVTTKEAVRDNYVDMISTRISKSNQKSYYTSGSTGIPLEMIRDQRAQDYSTALKAYAFMECGVKITDTFLTVAQAGDALLPNQHSILAKAKTDEIIAALKKIQPDVLYSYANILEVLTSEDMSGVAPRLIFSQGIKLRDHCRNLVKKSFGREVFDTYGSVEFSRLAFECKAHSGLHMITDGAVLEILKDGKPVPPGDSGDIVVTGLYNFSMPLIRYQQNDIGILSDDVCNCGRRWPLIKSIEGRSVDFFIMPSGKKIDPGELYFNIYNEIREDVFCVYQFQVVQEKKDCVVINIVQGKNFDLKIIPRLKKSIEKTFSDIDENVSVDVVIVDEIPKEKTGKVRTMVSMVN